MTTACARFAATAFFCLFFLAVSNGARAAEGAPDPSPFARTGLLVHPGETAEEILLRAHEFDAGAMALAVAGYNKGLGGFLKSRSVATEWSVLAFEMGLSRSAAFLFLLRDGGDAPEHDNSAEWLARCEYGKTSRLAPLFKEAGIFDIERECERLRSFKKKDAAWKKAYEKEFARWLSAAENSQTRVSRARDPDSWRLTGSKPEQQPPDWRMELAPWLSTPEESQAYVSRTGYPDSWHLTEGDWMKLKNYSVNPDFFLFYAATTHDPEQQSPDWRADRLMRLLSMREKDGGKTSRELARGVRTALMRRLGDDASPALDIARRAHAGDTDAARAMSMAYLDGRMNFPLSSRLAEIWLRRGAMAGDARCMELLATRLFAADDYRFAWVWATLASEYGDEDMRSRVEGIIRAVLQDYRVDKSGLPKLLERTQKRINDGDMRKSLP